MVRVYAAIFVSLMLAGGCAPYTTASESQGKSPDASRATLVVRWSLIPRDMTCSRPRGMKLFDSQKNFSAVLTAEGPFAELIEKSIEESRSGARGKSIAVDPPLHPQDCVWSRIDVSKSSSDHPLTYYLTRAGNLILGTDQYETSQDKLPETLWQRFSEYVK